MKTLPPPSEHESHATTRRSARHSARLGDHARRLRHDVTRWALARGVSVDFDALTVIIGAKSALAAPLRSWTEDDVWRLWWLDLSAWCARHGIAPPERLASSMLALFAHLEDTDGFGPGSDSRPALAAALRSAGGFGSLHEPASAS